MQDDSHTFRDLASEYPELQVLIVQTRQKHHLHSVQGYRRFCLPKNRNSIVFQVRGKKFGEPRERWDVLTVPVCTQLTCTTKCTHCSVVTSLTTVFSTIF